MHFLGKHPTNFKLPDAYYCKPDKGDSVVIFVISKAVDVFIRDTSTFDIAKTSTQFVANGGDIYTCATCAKMRNTENIQMCTITSIYDLYEIIKRSKKVVTF